jgi:putative transposase
VNKVVKIQIYTDNKEIYKIVHELMWETRKIQNKAICAMYEWSDFKFEYKDKHGTYPRPDEILLKKSGIDYYKTIGGYIDIMIRDKFYKNISNNSSSSVMEAMKLFKAKEKDMQKCLCTLPYYKTSSKINLHKQVIKILENDGNYYFDVGLLSTRYKKELNIESGRFLFNLYIGDNSQKTIVNRVLTGEYGVCESELRYVKRLKKFFLYLTYSFNQDTFSNNNDNVLGVDLGIKYPVYIALKDSLKRWKINGGEIEAFRKQVEKHRYLKRKQRVVAGKAGRKRGRERMLSPVVKISDKVARFRDRINHLYSSFIIDIAKKNNVGIIKMENLTGITENNLFLKNWPYYNLQQKIKYKAEILGIKVILIDPAYTSQECSHCGCIEKGNRETQEQFKCLACGFEANADYNAAVNIANKE